MPAEFKIGIISDMLRLPFKESIMKCAQLGADGILLKKTDPKVIYDFFAEGGIGDLRLDEYFKEVLPGLGKMPFERYLKALDDIGYNGFLTVERETGADPAKDIGVAVEFLKEKI